MEKENNIDQIIKDNFAGIIKIDQPTITDVSGKEKVLGVDNQKQMDLLSAMYAQIAIGLSGRVKDQEKDIINLRCELRIEKEKNNSLESYSRGLELKICEFENKTMCYETVVTTLDCKNHNVFIPENLDATQQLDYYDKIFGQWLSWAKK